MRVTCSAASARRPRYPSLEQIAALNLAAELPAAQTLKVSPGGTLHLEIPVNGLVLLEIAHDQRARR